MFGKAAEASGPERHGHSILQEGVTVQGEIEAAGDLRIDGRLEGKIRISERLTIGPQGTVTAEIEAGEVVVQGTVTGKIKARKRLEFRKGARVLGDISSPVLVIEEGVHFQGRANMDIEPESGQDYRTALDGTLSPETSGKADESSYDAAYR